MSSRSGRLPVIQSKNIQALPVDEIILQVVVDGVELIDTDVAGEFQGGFLLRGAVAQLRLAAQQAAAQSERSVLRDIGLDRRQIDAGEFKLQRSCQGLRRHIAAHVKRTGPVEMRIERDRERLGQIQACTADLQRKRRQFDFGGRVRGTILGRNARLLKIKLPQFELPWGARGGRRRGTRAESSRRRRRGRRGRREASAGAAASFSRLNCRRVRAKPPPSSR